MANRPTFIDLRSQSHGPLGTTLPSPSSRALPSPRLHIAGEIPPELSPLDAFAAQSRLLAKQLEQGNKSGRRISRLPPLTIASSLHQNKPGYFRSLSAEAPYDDPIPESPGPGQKTEVENPGFRPVSVYPQVGDGRNSPATAMPRFDAHDEERWRGRRPPSSAELAGYFGGRREQSPPHFERDHRFSRTGNSPSHIQPRPSMDSIRNRASGSRRPPNDNFAIGGYDSRTLAPPRSPFPQRTPSPRSISESSEDDFSSAANILSPPRETSLSSALSTSPVSTNQYSHHAIRRSPSIGSEMSSGGTQLPRPSFNFSRPLSQASTRSVSGLPLDLPSRQASSDSQPSFILADDTANTPVSLHSEGFPDNVNENGPAPSYVYSKFSLPRGKLLQRNSLIFQEQLSQPQHTFNGAPPPSPPSRPSTSSHATTEDSQQSSELVRPLYDIGRPSTGDGPRLSRFSEDTSISSPSAASSSTIKARSQHSNATTADMDGEEHVAKAIEFHEAGSLTKSTYHLRLAARQNNPTGMLLYALACRHGWGMRPNQKEGVAWLRKAADSASLEVAEDEDLEKDGKAVDYLEKKARKAQFALSIYELGVSHMNGWGIEQDKGLALRCFEIAGSWGDADALAEAGFCYAQGIGCKKDLKKSARFYRQAEAKGISMIGNSWFVETFLPNTFSNKNRIYKAKYNDDAESNAHKKSSDKEHSSPEKDKKRSKSKQRTFFGRMKSST
jgi:TPR repeat protein